MQDLSPGVRETIMSSWRPATQKQYGTYINRWVDFSRERGYDPHAPAVNSFLEFLAYLYDSGLKYSALNTARSAVSALTQMHDGFSMGAHPLVVRFMKGVFEKRPAIPKNLVVCPNLDYKLVDGCLHSTIGMQMK